jgi:hypothetical protein
MLLLYHLQFSLHSLLMNDTASTLIPFTAIFNLENKETASAKSEE